MKKDSYQQYKKDFTHLYQQAKVSNYPIILVSAQMALAHAAIEAGRCDKASKWITRAKDTLKNAGMMEDGYINEFSKMTLKA